MADPAYVERTQALRKVLTAQHDQCARCKKHMTYAHDSSDSRKPHRHDYHLPELGTDYGLPVLCMKCWEKKDG